MSGAGCTRSNDLIGDWQVNAENPILKEPDFSGPKQTGHHGGKRTVEKRSRAVADFRGRQFVLPPGHSHRQMEEPSGKLAVELRDQSPLAVKNLCGRIMTDQG